MSNTSRNKNASGHVLESDGRDIHKVVDNGVDGEAGGRVDLEFAGDVATMGNDGIDGDAEMVGNLFVRHALHQSDNYIFLAVGKGLVAVHAVFEHHVGDISRYTVLPGELLQASDGGHEDMVFDHGVLTQPYFVLVDVMEGGGELIVVQTILRQIFDDEQFQLAQLLVGGAVML